jgi:hypothetical protein
MSKIGKKYQIHQYREVGRYIQHHHWTYHQCWRTNDNHIATNKRSSIRLCPFVSLFRSSLNLADMDFSSWLLVIELGSKSLLGDVSCLLALLLWFSFRLFWLCVCIAPVHLLLLLLVSLTYVHHVTTHTIWRIWKLTTITKHATRVNHI